MPADFVALDLVYLSSERCEVAAVVHQAGTITRLLFLLGYDELAARARAHAVTAECLPAANAHDVARVLAERAAELPWVTYDLGEDLAAWSEADET
ncbi:MAG: hypothetical protein HUU35_18550, partial [Armatimonadetes bacterium]|nr:hypothetical protein [Armatimonadota bacterium]